MFSGLNFLKKDDNGLDDLFAGAIANDKSNLADIFEADDSDKFGEGNPSLKYVPPKANQSQETAEKASWNVVIAKIVGAFKLLNDTNKSFGQLGMALLKNPADNAHKLILYRTKEQILSTLQLAESVKVYWKPPYLQYHDDINGFWSLLFASDNDSNAFFGKLEEVCIVDRTNSTKTESKAFETEKDTSKPVEPVKSTKPVENKTSENTSRDDIDGSIPSSKAAVVHRVAKIGHQLPNFKPPFDDDSDSSTLPSDSEKIPYMSSTISSIIPDKIGTIGSNHITPSHISPSYIPPKPANISLALQPSIWTSGYDFSSFASENRIQNTEVRMNLTKLDSKLDRVLDNIERLRLNSSTEGQDKEEEIIKLEEKVLELKKENRALKLQLADKEQMKNESNDKDNEELIASKKKNEELELQITDLTKKLEDLEEKHKTMTVENEKERQQIIEKHAAELDNLRDTLDKKQKELETQQESNKTNNNNNNAGGGSNNGELIRGIMNQFYVKLYQSIEEQETMSTADILKLTAEIIRKETKAALNSN